MLNIFYTRLDPFSSRETRLGIDDCLMTMDYLHGSNKPSWAILWIVNNQCSISVQSRADHSVVAIFGQFHPNQVVFLDI
jgi:hypothetical protein